MTEKSVKRHINESKEFNFICKAFPGMRGFRNKDHKKKHCTPGIFWWSIENYGDNRRFRHLGQKKSWGVFSKTLSLLSLCLLLLFLGVENSSVQWDLITSSEEQRFISFWKNGDRSLKTHACFCHALKCWVSIFTLNTAFSVITTFTKLLPLYLSRIIIVKM